MQNKVAQELGGGGGDHLKKLRAPNTPLASAINKNPFFLLCFCCARARTDRSNIFPSPRLLSTFIQMWYECCASDLPLFAGEWRMPYVPACHLSIYLRPRSICVLWEFFLCRVWTAAAMCCGHMFRCLKQMNAKLFVSIYSKVDTDRLYAENRWPIHQSCGGACARAINEHGGYGEWMIHAFDARCPLHDRTIATNRHQSSALCLLKNSERTFDANNMYY